MYLKLNFQNIAMRNAVGVEWEDRQIETFSVSSVSEVVQTCKPVCRAMFKNLLTCKICISYDLASLLRYNP